MSSSSFPGRKPFRVEVFRACQFSSSMEGVDIDGKNEIGALASSVIVPHVRSLLEVTMTTPDGKVIERSGPGLTIFRKEER